MTAPETLRAANPRLVVPSSEGRRAPAASVTGPSLPQPELEVFCLTVPAAS